MCGICGAISDDMPTRELEAPVKQMLAALRHRGPDGSGMAAVSGNAFSAVFGHTRLSILDLSDNAKQPMWSDGDVIVFNGEIYNFRELARSLRAAGVNLRSTGDTEVLLKLRSQRGAAAVKDLRGMFAFAQYIERDQAVYFARDEFGIKPLYYYHDRSRGLFVFASEIRALLASGLVPRRVSIPGLRSLLAFGSACAPFTIVNQVQAAPPGTWFQIRDPRAALQFTPYVPKEEDWIRATPDGPAQEAEDRFGEELQRSVGLHLISDARLGCFLSAGVDSSTLALLSSRETRGDPVETFCLSTGKRDIDESDAASETAKLLRTKHSTVRVDHERLSREFPEVLSALDQPSFDGANVYFISRESRRLGLKVMLSGLGGDEALGGYGFSRQRALSRFLNAAFDHIPNPIRWKGPRGEPASWKYALDRAAERLQETPGVIRWLQRMQWTPAGMRAALLRDPEWESEGGSVISPELRERLRVLPAGTEGLNSQLKAMALSRMSMTFLADADVMGMANSQEIRVPFVDRQVFRTAFRIPSVKKRETPSKAPLRRILHAGGLASAANNKAKLGFHIPFASWLRRPEGLPVASGVDLLGTLAESELFSSRAISLVRRYQAEELQIPWAVPYLLLVTAEYCQRHSLRI